MSPIKWALFMLCFFFCFFFFVLVPSVMLAKSFSLPHKSPLCPLQRKTQPAILHSWRKGGEKPPSQSLKLALPSRSNWNLHNWGERAWKWARGLMAVVVLGRSGFFLSSGSVQTGVRRQGRATGEVSPSPRVGYPLSLGSRRRPSLGLRSWSHSLPLMRPILWSAFES